MKVKKIVIIFFAALILLGGAVSSGVFGFSWNDITKAINLPDNFQIGNTSTTRPTNTVNVVSEESVIISVVESASPSVVTIGISKTRRTMDFFEFDPFNPFSPFRRQQGKTEHLEQDIGSGFIVDSNGLIITNKHVVQDRDATYRVITNDDTSFDVEKIFRDPVNDLAILKINANNLQAAVLGDSDSIKVGQLAIAIGTALGEFRHTVTTGVISGVGRGITAGDPYEGYVERLDNVIQTDAAINFGNSGGPLLNSSGEVIGVNTAIAGNGENIGFAFPINVVSQSLDSFNVTGSFNRPFIGVRYKTIAKDLALLNDVPEGAYIVEIVEGGPAESAGLQVGDIIMSLDGVRLAADQAELATIIKEKRAGETVNVVVWREGEEVSLKVALSSSDE